MNEQFRARANLILLIFGFVILIYVIKVAPSLLYDPIVYELKVSGNRFLSTKYIKNIVMPVGGVRLSALTVPYDPFIKSYSIKYEGNGMAQLFVTERTPAFISSTSMGYFLTSPEGVFLAQISKDDLYKLTGMMIVFGIDSFNFNGTGIINPVLVSEIDEILSYPALLKKEILEVDIKTNTLYFAKGVSVRFENLNLSPSVDEVILSMIKTSKIGSRYIFIDNNFIELPQSF
uniref:FtsQ-type POTRA domain-containing protein n=1 Tax=Mesoaciditoga lauensis TaxID=1495039 RepID=A0A7V3VSU4_9BACT